ncbi:MAG: HisA/HisF-related TIM barrel protein [Thermoplasmatota archaeon]
MKVIPSISFKGGKPVTVKNGHYEHYSKSGNNLDYNDVLSLLSDYDIIYLLDLNGIESRGLQSEVIRKVSTRREVWADVGARDTATITDGYIAGADRIVISTKTMYSIDLMNESSRISDKMIFCIDYKDGVISPSNEIKQTNIKELIVETVETGIDTIVIHDLSDKNFDTALLDYIPDKGHELYIGGKIDIDKIDLYEDKVDGVILGLEDSIKWQARI